MNVVTFYIERDAPALVAHIEHEIVLRLMWQIAASLFAAYIYVSPGTLCAGTLAVK